MIREILEENIYYYKNVIKDPKKLIEKINDSENYPEIYNVVPKWDSWEASAGIDYIYGHKKNINEASIDSLSPEIREKADFIISSINNAFSEVVNDFAIQKNIKEPLELAPWVSIRRYQKGAYMGSHHDQQDGDTTLSYSLVLYINDDYEGGEISFTIKDQYSEEIDKQYPDFDNENNKNLINFGIKPEAGSVLIFPSYKPYRHMAHIIKSGYKYMSPTHCINNKKDVKYE